jgi:hypothetical protein
MCAVGVLTLLWSGAANAQATDSTGPYLLRVGGYLPSNGHTKEALGNSFLSIGAGVNVRKFESFLPTTVEAYADYFNQIKNHGDASLGRVQASVLGVGLLAKYSLDPKHTMTAFHPYAGTGVGVYWAHVNQQTPDGYSQSNNRTTLGGKFLLGAEIAGGLFGEVDYTFAPRPSVFDNKVTLSGTELRLGYHF